MEIVAIDYASAVAKTHEAWKRNGFRPTSLTANGYMWYRIDADGNITDRNNHQ